MNIINSFVDLVSYIRLFAVGAATVAVAQSFNSMALGMQMHPLLKGLAVAVILLLGHGLNIVLCAMSVLVHGIRLNMLEFSGHLGMEWAGVPYRPLAKPSRRKQS
jgi:V/A-type H+-transporting ATPase subunit I